jgi:hypothetical protein
VGRWSEAKAVQRLYRLGGGAKMEENEQAAVFRLSGRKKSSGLQHSGGDELVRVCDYMDGETVPHTCRRS